ncbi:MAG: hypothetical protein K0R65_415 [Crocinitomicaceae bacterium]|nr:hypothetical protein [Crocinitomicaceae bacterium]
MFFYTSSFKSEFKSDGSPVTEADLASSECILEILSQTGIPVIDEESEEISYEIRQNWKQCWCVDPLDGTKEFIKKNGEFAVNIALIEDHKAVFGLIASPVEEKIIIGSGETGVYIFDFAQENDPASWKKIDAPGKRPETFSLISSRTHYSGNILKFVTSIENRFGPFGTIQKGSSLKFFDLAENRASIYPRFAPTMEWDIAAGQAILENLGGIVVQAEDHSPLRYNKPDLRNPYFVALTQPFAHEFRP